MNKLTHAEHDTRAALMGMHYDWRDGTYFHMDGVGNPQAIVPYLDAMTLQEVARHEAHIRRVEWGTYYAHWEKKNDRPATPYAYGENQDAHT